MARGGKRPGAGRPKGSVEAKTVKRREVAEKALEQGITPLEVMLEAMRSALGPEGTNYVAAQPFARDAAPFVHPKLAATEVKMEADVRSTVSAEPLTPEQWESEHGAQNPH
jgi:hypothetical protein